MKKYIPLFLLSFTPLVSFAAFDGLRGLIDSFRGIVDITIPIVGSIALLAFLWGLVKFIYGGGKDEKAQAEGKNVMKWGLIALFVMVSVWGIVNFIQRNLGLPETNGTIPQGVVNPCGSGPCTQFPAGQFPS